MEAKTIDERLDLIDKRIKGMQRSQYIQTAIVIIGFLGFVTISSLLKKIKK